MWYKGGDNQFQSTLPMRGATLIKNTKVIFFKISIHAPHEGSDHWFRQEWILQPEFQSTLPMRGATAKQYKRQMPVL